MFFILDVSCSDPDLMEILNIVRNVIKVIQLAIPIMLIIWGSLDLGRAVMASKEDEIKKAQTTLVKRAIAAALVFLLGLIVNFVLRLVGGKDYENCLEQAQVITENSNVKI